ncbi:MAG: GNAT family N-acetyltransferase [Candidatus Riflebacteria bacterium]|nr:GNAT family N-acetyltransferase [Candidatus Riflebacteria bacterium]
MANKTAKPDFAGDRRVGRNEDIKGRFLVIKTTFGCLRGYALADGESLTKYANNPKIAGNLRDGFPYPYTRENALEFISIAMSKTPPTLLAIANDREVIGGIGLMVKTDVHRLTAELGYWLGEPFWGMGIVPEAVRAIVNYGFESLGLLRISAEPYSSNPASCRVLEKAGFVFEGRQKNNVIKNGKILDSMMFAITCEPKA